MQSSSDRLSKYHNYNNYLYSHHSTNYISNCDLSLCAEVIQTTESNPLARKVTLKPDSGKTLAETAELTRGVDVDIKSQSQYLSHNKTCTNTCVDNVINKPGVGVKNNSYHRYNSAVKSKTIQSDA
jgi:hypothetical protein